MNVVFSHRLAGGLPYAPGRVKFTVDWFSSAALGGPKEAVISAQADDFQELCMLLDLARASVTISNKDGRAAWWGYVHEVEVIRGQYGAGISLDGLYNRAAVAYMKAEAGKSTAARVTTPWGEDAASSTEYGKKELLYGASWATPTQALATRDRLIAENKAPGAVQRFYPTGRGTRAVIRCLGWYQTLSWLHYANPSTAEMDSAAQAAAIAMAAGQFFSSVDQEVSSGINVNAYKDGDGTAKGEFETLLKLGTAAGERLLARVDEDKRLHIFTRPTNSLPYLIGSGGQVLDPQGNPMEKADLKAGEWARLQNMPFGLSSWRWDDPSLFFIESIKYTPSGDSISIIPEAQHGI